MSLVKLVITEKLAVYGQGVHLSLSAIDFLITTPNRIIGPNDDAPEKYKQKPTFVERVKLDHN
jgi:hypothetical protein